MDFQEAIWALCPDAVLNLLRDSLKLGPDSIVLSGFTEVSGSLYDWLDWKREEAEVFCWGGEVYTCLYDVYVWGEEAEVYS